MAKSNKKSPLPQRQLGNRPDGTKQPEKKLLFSFEHLDRVQGQDFLTWEKEGLLAKACEKLVSISQLTRTEATTLQIIKEYPAFPPDSEFEHPKHVPSEVRWASLHVQGKECLIGYLQENVFYVVFLDKDHEFWPTSKKNT